MRHEKVCCNDMPFVGNVLGLRPGLYSAVFSNTYSWFNLKDLKFRITVLDARDIDDSAHSHL